MTLHPSTKGTSSVDDPFVTVRLPFPLWTPCHTGRVNPILLKLSWKGQIPTTFEYQGERFRRPNSFPSGWEWRKVETERRKESRGDERSVSRICTVTTKLLSESPKRRGLQKKEREEKGKEENSDRERGRNLVLGTIDWEEDMICSLLNLMCNPKRCPDESKQFVNKK